MRHKRAIWLTVSALAAVCVLVAAACQGRSADLLADHDPKVQWEYKSLMVDANRPFDEKQFNGLGAEGWELAGSFTYKNESADPLVFKRVKQK